MFRKANLLNSALLLLLSASALGDLADELPHFARMSAERRLRSTAFGHNGALQPLINRLRGKYARCVPSVCFMLAGSSALTAAQLQLQRDFVFTAAGLLQIANPAISFSAVQYAQGSHVVSPPTRDARQFQTRVLNRRSLPRRYRVRLAPAMFKCLSQFARMNRAPRKLVIVADSRAPREREAGPLRPARVAQFFRRAVGSDVCAVTVGNGGRRRLRRLVRGDRFILQANAWGVIQLRKLLEPLIASICDSKSTSPADWNQFDQ